MSKKVFLILISLCITHSHGNCCFLIVNEAKIINGTLVAPDGCIDVYDGTKHPFGTVWTTVVCDVCSCERDLMECCSSFDVIKKLEGCKAELDLTTCELKYYNISDPTKLCKPGGSNSSWASRVAPNSPPLLTSSNTLLVGGNSSSRVSQAAPNSPLPPTPSGAPLAGQPGKNGSSWTSQVASNLSSLPTPSEAPLAGQPGEKQQQLGGPGGFKTTNATGIGHQHRHHHPALPQLLGLKRIAVGRPRWLQIRRRR